MKREIKKVLFLFLAGGLVYMFFEVLFGTVFNPAGNKSFRGLMSMFVLGGFLFIVLGLINEIKFVKKHIPDYLQFVIAGVIITISELLSGILLNLYLKWNVWDYTGYPLSILGQVCLPFMILWIVISPFAFFLDDYLRGIYNLVIQENFNLGR